MIDFDVIAYAMLGLSLSASAVQVGRWILNANPRTLISAGRWSMAGFIVVAPLVLLTKLLICTDSGTAQPVGTLAGTVNTI